MINMGVMLSMLWRQWVDGQRICGPMSYRRISKLAPDLRRSGFTAIQFKPVCKTISGRYPTDDGYGLFDPYDIGSKDQWFSRETSWGNAEELRQSIAVIKACGMQAYGDYVMHQYNGWPYRYKGADGKTLNGRFPKDAQCFVGAPPRVGVDPVFNPEGNFAFGDMVSYVNSKPRDYMARETVWNAQWWARTCGWDGFRMDAFKGTNPGFSKRLRTAPYLDTKYAYGELFDSNPNEISRAVGLMDGSTAMMDFGLHFALQAVCDYGASMQVLNGAGYTARDPYHSVTFVDSADTDTSDGQKIVNNKGLAYAFLMTVEGYPSVYWKDYSTDPGCYGLKPLIDNLIWCHENLARGKTVTQYLDNTVIVLNRVGYPGMLTAINRDTYNRRKITCHTEFGPNVELHDYTGKHPNVWTDGYGNATFTIPANAYNKGQSYLVFSRTGYTQSFTLQHHATTQTFFGAEDLDTPPATPTGTPVSWIWCDRGTDIKLGQVPRDITFEITDKAGTVIVARGSLKGRVKLAGEHRIKVFTEDHKTHPFEVAITYTATQGLVEQEKEAA